MLIVANWKAYVEDSAKAKKLFEMAKKLAKETGTKIVLAPPAPLLGALSLKNRSAVAFAAQDISATTGGAKTGEATAQAYAAAGADYAIIGHSERRAQGDTDAIVAEKLAHALAHGLTPILCIGERERDGEGRYLATIREELTSALAPLSAKERMRVTIAYEPLWAVGAAAAIRPDDLNEIALYVRKILSELLPGKSARRMTVLYGGAVDPGNAQDLVLTGSIDGFLVGRASVEPQTFAALVKGIPS